MLHSLPWPVLRAICITLEGTWNDLNANESRAIVSTPNGICRTPFRVVWGTQYLHQISSEMHWSWGELQFEDQSGLGHSRHSPGGPRKTPRQWKPRYRLFTTWYNGKANSWFWSNCIAALTHHDTALRTTDSQAALQPSPTMDRREHPWASIVEDASIIPARTSISQHIARLTACNIPRELQIMPDMKTPVALPLRLLLKWFRNNHVRWSWSLKGGVHETYNGHSWGTSRARCKEDQRQIVDGTAWDAGKGSKERKSGKSNWVKWAEKRNNNGGAKGVAEEMEMQEVEKEVAAEVRPVRKLNIKKKAPWFADIWCPDSHNQLDCGDCGGQSWRHDGRDGWISSFNIFQHSTWMLGPIMSPEWE